MFRAMPSSMPDEEAQPRPLRLSFSSRMSRAWRRDTTTTAWTDQSHQGETFVVPLFLSTPERERARQRQNEDAEATPELRHQRSRTSIRSMIEPEDWPQRYMSPSLMEGSSSDEASRYSVPSQYNPAPVVARAPTPPIVHHLPVREVRRVKSTRTDSALRPQSSTKSPWKRRQARAKLRLSIAFGITLLATIILCKRKSLP